MTYLALAFFAAAMVFAVLWLHARHRIACMKVEHEDRIIHAVIRTEDKVRREFVGRQVGILNNELPYISDDGLDRLWEHVIAERFHRMKAKEAKS